MAEVFGAVAAAVGLAQLCKQIATHVSEIKRDGAAIGSQLEDLATEIDNIQRVCESVRTVRDKSLGSATPTSPGAGNAKEETTELWQHVKSNISSCDKVMRALQVLLTEICGEDPDDDSSSLKQKLHRMKMVDRKRSRKGDLQRAREQLVWHQNTLTLLLTLISMQALAKLSSNLDEWGSRLSSKIQDLEENGTTAGEFGHNSTALNALHKLQSSINLASKFMSSEETTEFFNTPQTVSSYYVGREDLLEELRDTFIQSPGPSHRQYQRRFVIRGMGGSGKTQFCSKFAEENRARFWGVFCVDGSSETNLEQGMSMLGRQAGLDKNTATTASASAAMHWLSTVEKRWLLIIDNADDAEIELEKYFPKGNLGHILITTRVPGFARYGNIEPSHYDFGIQSLSPKEASSLLLRASLKGSPERSDWDIARVITESLGFLSLAIIQAGAAIRNQLCTLLDFQDFYDMCWKGIRNHENPHNDQKKEHEVCAITTWEMLYLKMETKNSESIRDAIQLLKVFAYLHREHIPRELLERAIVNPPLEAEQAANDKQQADSESRGQATTWLEWLSSQQMRVLISLFRNRGPVALPEFMRTGGKPRKVEAARLRLRYALNELLQRSLIDYNENSDSYTMHTIVHKWARRRPQMTLGEQCLWADTASMVLSASILLPPLGLKTEDEMYHLSLLPHVEHVQARRKAIRQEMESRREEKWVWRLFPGLGVYEDQLRMFGKFGLIYARAGRFDEAESLISVVNDTLRRVLGEHHSRTRSVTLVLSDLYWHMGKPADAYKLQKEVLAACELHLGRRHPDTSRVMSKLGNTLWQQGLYSDALELQREAEEALRDRLGPNHQDTLLVTDQLGRTITKFYSMDDFKEASQLHRTAMERMERVHGHDHPRTLDAKENLVRVTLLMGHDHAEAAKLMSDVLEKRKLKLGKDNPFTLLAMVNMALANCALRKPEDGEKLIKEALPVATAMYGPKHIATLFGRSMLAVTLIDQSRYEEAETILAEVSSLQRDIAARSDVYHPDRLGTLISLARCYQLQGKMRESIEACDEALRGFSSIVKPDAVHPLAEQLREARDKMMLHVQAGTPEALHVAFPAIHFAA
ncbi:hypothetical protein F5X68DRAFT_173967 [Plectosphaerella plurivora]|uniref:Uncharacterized protein n=1 Tax=Plectosphaerella plurivora TaxID=936078 RepID=A0A9P8V3H8_9PEZI|nr:hypothetical protein F5X68DRAFT_173967 [Plectosphaerella plurivora]